MDKGIGFNRWVDLAWLDAAAAFCVEGDDPVQVRERLEPVVAQDLRGVEARRKTVDVLVNIWCRSGEVAPALRAWALGWFGSTVAPEDRRWLHYGLTLVRYPFFRECAAAIGQSARQGQGVRTGAVVERVMARRGNLGSVPRSVERVVTTLKRWGLLGPSEERNVYVPCRHVLTASAKDLEAWLLACALRAHPAEELPFVDLLNLPELFPFQFTVGVEDLQACRWFAVRREASGWEMVRLRDT